MENANYNNINTYFDKFFKNKEINLPLYIKSYLFEFNNLSQERDINEIENLNDKNIIKIESGGEHNLSLSSDGKVYAWGLNSSGQLGFYEDDEYLEIFKEDIKLITTPILIKDLENIKIKIISCGEVHSLALSQNGDIYSWGGCSYGQLGHSFMEIMPKDENNKPFLPIPTIIESIKDIKMIDISCGQFHNLSIDNNGNIYSWGNATFGQIGIKDIYSLPKNEEGFYYQSIPYKLKELKEKNIYIMKAACGNDHSLLLSTEGKIFSFGANNLGQLGIEEKNFNENNIPFVNFPTQVKGIIENKIINYICCGNYFSMVIDNENNLYGWGMKSKNHINNNNELIINIGNDKVEKVWCGNFCWIAVSKEGIIFGNYFNNKECYNFGEKYKNFFNFQIYHNLIYYNINNITFGNNFCIISPEEKNNISLKKELYYKFKENLYTDITIVYREHKIQCHKIILISSCDYFYKEINLESKEIVINSKELKVEYYIFLTIIQYIYLKIQNFIYENENIEELSNYLKTCKYLGINELIEPIKTKLEKIISKDCKLLSILNSNRNNINEIAKKRILIGLDGTVYFLLDENINHIIKENSVVLNKKFKEKKSEFKQLNIINNNNKNCENNELLLSSQIHKKMNKKKIEKNNDLEDLLNNLTEEKLIKKNIIISSKPNYNYKYFSCINNEDYNDLTINIGNYKFYCSKIFLISSSDFFSDLLKDKDENKIEINLDNCTPFKIYIIVLFFHLYEYFDFSLEMLLELLSSFYLFKFKQEFKLYIEEEIKKLININNAITIYTKAKKCFSVKLEKICLFYIRENFEIISKINDFEKLSNENILEIKKLY